MALHDALAEARAILTGNVNADLTKVLQVLHALAVYIEDLDQKYLSEMALKIALAETIYQLMLQGHLPFSGRHYQLVQAVLRGQKTPHEVYSGIDTNGQITIARDVLFGGQKCVVACDAKCHKAWGMNQRLQFHRDNTGAYRKMSNEEIEDRAICPDENDTMYLPDADMDEAPVEPGTWEGEDTKPVDPEDRLNKWCTRECERSVLVDRGHPITLPNFDHPVFNMEPHDRGPVNG